MPAFNDPSKCLQENITRKEKTWLKSWQKSVRTLWGIEQRGFEVSLSLSPWEKPPSFLLSSLQIVLFSLQRSFPPSCSNQCRVALSTCWGLKACGIRLFAANEFKDSITVTRERAGRRRSHNTRCRCVTEAEKERECFSIHSGSTKCLLQSRVHFKEECTSKTNSIHTLPDVVYSLYYQPIPIIGRCIGALYFTIILLTNYFKFFFLIKKSSYFIIYSQKI